MIGPAREHPSREPQNVERRGIRPVQVLDHHDERADRRETLEQRGEQFAGPVDSAVVVLRAARALRLGEPPQGVAVRTGRLRDRLDAVFGDDATEEAGEGGIGDVDGPEIDALADYHEGVVGGAFGELGDETGLADAGLAADDGDARVAGEGLVEEGAQFRQLGLASDHDL